MDPDPREIRPEFGVVHQIIFQGIPVRQTEFFHPVGLSFFDIFISDFAIESGFNILLFLKNTTKLSTVIRKKRNSNFQYKGDENGKNQIDHK